jgi:hypothetical protein
MLGIVYVISFFDILNLVYEFSDLSKQTFLYSQYYFLSKFAISMNVWSYPLGSCYTVISDNPLLGPRHKICFDAKYCNEIMIEKTI